MKKPDSSDTFASSATGLRYDYLPFFSNDVYSLYFLAFPKRLSSAKDEAERVKIFNEARVATGLYCSVVYNIYPNSRDFKTGIDSSPELSANFRNIKKFLDGHGGREAAGEMLNVLLSSISDSIKNQN